MSSQEQNKKPTVLILQGLPASGKTTYARELQVREPGVWRRINRDDMRESIDNNYWQKGMDTALMKASNFIMKEFIRSGYNVIIDNTNLSPWVIKDITKAVGETAIIEIKFFDTTLDECIERNKKRNKSKPVPEQVIRDMAEQYNLS